MFQDISALSVMANADYYEVVRLGNEETKHYICSICEKEKKMFVSEESELRIIQHIQKNHAEKHLVVETTKKITKLVSHSSKEAPQDGTPVQKFKLRQSNVKIKDVSEARRELGTEHIFFPCEECPDIFLTRTGIRTHMLTHQKERKIAQKSTLFPTTITNEDGVTFQAEIGTNHIFFPCEECQDIFLAKEGKIKHMLTHD